MYTYILCVYFQNNLALIAVVSWLDCNVFKHAYEYGGLFIVHMSRIVLCTAFLFSDIRILFVWVGLCMGMLMGMLKICSNNK